MPGVTAASRAGILTVGLSTSQAPQVLLEAGAQLVVKNFDDERLWQLIAQMSG